MRRLWQSGIRWGKQTLILSLLNGITSEGILAEAYGREKVVDCVAYGMDAVKEGNRLTYRNMGKLCIGPPRGHPVAGKRAAGGSLL